MRRSFVKAVGFLVVALLVAVIAVAGANVLRAVSKSLVVPMATAMAQSAKGTNDAGADTTDAEDLERIQKEKALQEAQEAAREEKKERKEGSLSIKIDESGIRIEGSTTDGGESDTSSHRIIFDAGDWTSVGGDRTYRERGSDIVRFGEDVRVDADELVRGDVVVFGGDVSVSGKVVGNVVVFGGDATMRSGAEINGDVVVLAGELEEEPEVLIYGERVMFKNLNLSFANFPFFFGHGMRVFDAFWIPLKFFISVILSFLILLFLRGRVVRSQEHVSSAVFKSFGAGFLVAFLGLFVVLFLTIVLLITLIGIPLAFVLIVSCIAVFIIADTVFVYALGAKVNEKLNIQTQNPFGIVLMGMAVLYLPALLGLGFSLLPFGGPVGAMFKFFGWMLGFFAFLTGLGALFLSRFGTRDVRVDTVAAAAPAPE
ncbi:MAG: hypothetical protein JSW50_10230 [Candidatus Latescibacterota bacterium]|nr:MAG: hypothetical protein JSW50_10230 [Candidatus Latescibacterota bacterium]